VFVANVVRRGAHSTILAGWCGVAATHHAVPHDTVVFHVLHFPDPDSNELRPFGQAFVRMMFAHAELEREILSLRNSIRGNSDFREKLPPPRDRPDWIKKLIDKHAPGMPEN
jgi:hypothetical protein